MKKILATILALTMVLSLGVSAFAANTSPEAGTENITGNDVGSLTNNNLEIAIQLDGDVEPSPAPAYYVTVAWQSMKFTYTPGTAKSGWDGTTHSYSNEAVVGSWSNGTSDTSTITITNHSNVGVTVNATYTGGDVGFTNSGSSYQGVTITAAGITGEELDAGEEGSQESADSTTCTVKVEGTPTAKFTEFDAGQVTVQISAAST